MLGNQLGGLAIQLGKLASPNPGCPAIESILPLAAPPEQDHPEHDGHDGKEGRLQFDPGEWELLKVLSRVSFQPGGY